MINLVTQGPGYIGIADLKNLANEIRPENRRMNQLKSNVFTVLLSGLTTIATVLTLGENILSIPTLALLGAVGWGTLFYSRSKLKQRESCGDAVASESKD